MLENDEETYYKIKYHRVLEHAPIDHEKNLEEQLYQDQIEDYTLLNNDFLLTHRNVTRNIGKVIERNRRPDRKFMVQRDSNPILDSRVYVVHYSYWAYYMLT